MKPLLFLAKCSVVNGVRRSFQTPVRAVATIIARWAPSNENNTAAYIAAVAGSMKVDPDIHLDVSDYSQLYPLVDAIIRHENGRNIYPRTTMDAGLALAGVTP